MAQLRAADIESTRRRMRARRACARSSQKKLQCSNSGIGIPCTGFRQNVQNHCASTPSGRGIYARGNSDSISYNSELVTAPNTDDLDKISCENPRSKLRSLVPAPLFTHSVDEDLILTEPALSPTRSEAVPTPGLQEDSLDSSTCSSSICLPSTPRSSSTTSSNPGYPLPRHRIQHEDVFERSEVLSPAQLSLFNFTQKEPTLSKKWVLERPKSRATVQTRSCDKHNEMEEEPQTSKMSSIDIEYLHSKGAFEFPTPDVLEKLIDAFLNHFHPLYSIFDIEELEISYRQQRITPILLHAICLIGATYCDQDVIVVAGYDSRRCARRAFYEKAKLLFDLGYETDAIVLLQTTVMLSFWGPQLGGYSSPYSWICSAINIARSLGIQYESFYGQISDARHKGLLRRLWWTVVRRDAYFAALLGRPPQIDLSRHDIQMLTLDDFDSVSTIRTGTGSALFQIECAKLSLILRHIIKQGDMQTDTNYVQNLHDMLEQWQTELHIAVDWKKKEGPTEMFSSSLKLMFYHHLILIHLGKRAAIDSGEFISDQMSSVPPSRDVMLAAQTVSSTAFSLMMHSMAGNLAHEAFSAFLVSIIVLLQHEKQPHDLIASLRRSALDNCLLILNKVHERWDASLCAFQTLNRLQSNTLKSETDGLSEETDNARSRPKEVEVLGTNSSYQLGKYALTRTVVDSGQKDVGSASSIIADLMSTILPSSPCPKIDESFDAIFSGFVSAAEDALWLDSEIVIFE